jgi:glycosyltransferase involved in cell wall biosynthesis
MDKILIIIPVHNEEENLPALLPELKQEAKRLKADMVAVNDASIDNSLYILQKSGIQTLSHPSQMGYGVTIQTGYKYGLENNYDYVIQIDGDGQHDPRCIKSILTELKKGESDIVIGSRFLPKNKIPFKPRFPLYYGTPTRRLGIHVFRFVLRCLCFTKISDPTSGFIGFNRRTLHFLSGKSFPFDYPDADVVFTFLRNGFRLREIPVYMYPKEKRYSLHRGCRPLWYIVKVSIAIFIAFLRQKEVVHEQP